MEPHSAKNLTRVILLGNEDWMVPASADERRYAVFNVGTGRMQDNVFFSKMIRQMDELGGNEILYRYLLDFDLSKVDVNVAPQTEALMEQKLISLSPFHHWLHESLQEDRLLGTSLEEPWPEEIGCQTFRNAYESFKEDRSLHEHGRASSRIGRHLKAIFGDVKHRKREGDKLAWVYHLPPLEEAKQIWNDYLTGKRKGALH